MEHWLRSPAAESLRTRLEDSLPVSLESIAPAAWSLVIALLHRLHPHRALLVVVDTLRTQETLHADLTLWREGRRPLFFPAWEVLPHESKLPHADIISERLETLVALRAATLAATLAEAPLVIASVTALQQRTFTPEDLALRTRCVRHGDTLNPLDLIEWLEEQGYEPEAQVTNKGELSWRGGIVDVWPLNCPWPLRLEFFGDELESMREFDPLKPVANRLRSVSFHLLENLACFGLRRWIRASFRHR